MLLGACLIAGTCASAAAQDVTWNTAEQAALEGSVFPSPPVFSPLALQGVAFPSLPAFSPILLKRSLELILPRIRQDRGGFSSSFSLLDEDTEIINLSPAGRVRFPAAGHAVVFVPGNFDGGLGMESSKTLRRFTLYADAYYTLAGADLAGQPADNRVALDLGAGYPVLPWLNAALSYEQKTPTGRGASSPPPDLAARAEFTPLRALCLFVSGSTVLPAAPLGYGLSAGAGFRF
jgi:hypothetical protein